MCRRQIQRQAEVPRLGGELGLELLERLPGDPVLLLGLYALAKVLIDRRDGEAGADLEPGLLHQRVEQLERLLILLEAQIDRGQLERHLGVGGVGLVPLLQADELLLYLFHVLIAQVEPLRRGLAAGGRRLALEDAVELLNAPDQVLEHRAIGIEPLVGGDHLNGVIAPGLRRRLVTGLKFIVAKREQQLGKVRQHLRAVRAKRPRLLERKNIFPRHPLLFLHHLVALGRVRLLGDGELVVVDAPTVDVGDRGAQLAERFLRRFVADEGRVAGVATEIPALVRLDGPVADLLDTRVVGDPVAGEAGLVLRPE